MKWFINDAKEFALGIQEKQIIDEKHYGAIMADFARESFTELFLFCLTCKNPAFEEEKEWRSVPLIFFGPIERLNSREVDGIIIPYVEVLFPSLKPEKPDQLPIVEIIQGPLVEPALGENSLRMLLKKHGYDDVSVRLSKVPIRF